MAQFFSEENLKLLTTISKKYLSDKYSYTVTDDKQLKKLIYDIVCDVDQECKGKSIPIEKKNIAVLNSTKEIYINKYKLSPAVKKTNIRDKEVFGDRKVTPNNMIPDIDPYQRKHTSMKDMSRIIENRDTEVYGEKKKIIDIAKLVPVTKETAENNELFMKRLKDLETQRSEMENRFKPEPVAVAYSNAKEQNATTFVAETIKHVDYQHQSHPQLLQRSINKYIDINSQDRDWQTMKHRYEYVINNLNKHNNIEAISVGAVIIPENIDDPYLFLKIDEFADLYDGTNDISRKSFCKLILEKQLLASESKRGYSIMKPIQNEILHFSSPVSAISKLSISLLKPNGELLNNNSDSYKITSVSSNFLVTTDKYFDTTEFSVNDVVLFKDYKMSPASPEFNKFINKETGHKIVKLADSNAAGYYNAFYIQAPGVYSYAIGQFVNDAGLCSFFDKPNIIHYPGDIMNLSLQNSISIKLDILV